MSGDLPSSCADVGRHDGWWVRLPNVQHRKTVVCCCSNACVDFCKRQWFPSKPQLSVFCLFVYVCVCFCNSFTFIRDKYISLVLLHTNCIYTVQKIILAINVSSFYATFLSHDLIVTFIHRVGLEINMHLFSFLLAWNIFNVSIMNQEGNV